MAEKPKYWMGGVPTKDDFNYTIHEFFVDGKTVMGGRWGIMSPAAHAIYGMGTGTGRGQMYQKQPDGRWLKIAG